MWNRGKYLKENISHTAAESNSSPAYRVEYSTSHAVCRSFDYMLTIRYRSMGNIEECVYFELSIF